MSVCTSKNELIKKWLLSLNLKNLKVSKSQKQILKFSFEPKNERKYFCISALKPNYFKKQRSSSSFLMAKIANIIYESLLLDRRLFEVVAYLLNYKRFFVQTKLKRM